MEIKMNTLRTEPLEELTRHPTEFIQRLKASGETVALTVDGKAELIVHSADVDDGQEDEHVLDEETEALLLERLANLDESQCKEAGPILQKMLDEQKARLVS